MSGTFETGERAEILRDISDAESLAKLATKDVYEAKRKLRDHEAKLAELKARLATTNPGWTGR